MLSFNMCEGPKKIWHHFGLFLSLFSAFHLKFLQLCKKPQSYICGTHQLLFPLVNNAQNWCQKLWRIFSPLLILQGECEGHSPWLWKLYVISAKVPCPVLLPADVVPQVPVEAVLHHNQLLLSIETWLNIIMFSHSFNLLKVWGDTSRSIISILMKVLNIHSTLHSWAAVCYVVGSHQGAALCWGVVWRGWASLSPCWCSPPRSSAGCPPSSEPRSCPWSPGRGKPGTQSWN